MPTYESPSLSVSRCGHRRISGDALRTVVWVRGEHDIATRVNLSATIAQVAGLDDADIVVDLSGVTFMDASTIGALIGARNRLRASCRSLSVRAPSPRARQVLDLCGLARLIDEHPAPVQPPVAGALGSWVDVPASDGSAQPPVANEAPSPEPARAPVGRGVEPAESIELPRAAS